MENIFTFLKLNQIYTYAGKKDKRLEIIKKYGIKAYATDFAILLGCRVDSLPKSFGEWCTSTSPTNYECYVWSVGVYGSPEWRYWSYSNDIGGRPVTSFSKIKKYCSRPLRLYNGVLEVEYGEYPQSVVDEDFSVELEKVFLSDMMKKTGKHYKMYAWHKTNDYAEYEYNGKKYIRIIGDTFRGYEQSCYELGKNNVEIDKKMLSDRRVIKDDEVYWVCVEPIKWLID